MQVDATTRKKRAPMPDDRQPKGALGGPRVSVVMAAYNGDRFITAAIDSIEAVSLGQPLLE